MKWKPVSELMFLLSFYRADLMSPMWSPLAPFWTYLYVLQTGILAWRLLQAACFYFPLFVLMPFFRVCECWFCISHSFCIYMRLYNKVTCALETWLLGTVITVNFCFKKPFRNLDVPFMWQRNLSSPTEIYLVKFFPFTWQLRIG